MALQSVTCIVYDKTAMQDSELFQFMTNQTPIFTIILQSLIHSYQSIFFQKPEGAHKLLPNMKWS